MALEKKVLPEQNTGEAEPSVARRATRGNLALTVEGVVQKLESFAKDRIGNIAKFGLVPRSLVLRVSVEGGTSVITLKFPLDPGMKHNPIQSLWVSSELKKVLGIIEQKYGRGKKVFVDVVSDRWDRVLNVRVLTAAQVEAALKGLVAAVPAPSGSGPASIAAPTPELSPSPRPAAALTPAATPELIDFETMKLYPDDPFPSQVYNIFIAACIGNKDDLVKFLGTLKPSGGDWENFIQQLSQIAIKANLPFDQNIDSSLYFWLVKKKWIKPFVSRRR